MASAWRSSSSTCPAKPESPSHSPSCRPCPKCGPRLRVTSRGRAAAASQVSEEEGSTDKCSSPSLPSCFCPSRTPWVRRPQEPLARSTYRQHSWRRSRRGVSNKRQGLSCYVSGCSVNIGQVVCEMVFDMLYEAMFVTTSVTDRAV